MNDINGSKEFLRLPVRALLDKDLTLSDVIVLSAIIDYVDDENKTMSIERIMKKTNLSNYQVRQSIKSLEKNNYITAGKKTIYKQCEVLPPKRQSQKKEKDKKIKNSFDADFDVEEYKVLINNI